MSSTVPNLAMLHSAFSASNIPSLLVVELLAAYLEAKHRFSIRDLRPNALEGGRFSEAAVRIVQFSLTSVYTPIGKALDRLDSLQLSFERAAGPDSLRLHIPRTIRVIYDVRNKRDIAHLADGIDPNLQDAHLVVACMDWILAEMVRVFGQISPEEATGVIAAIVTRQVPVLEDVDGFPRVLRTMSASNHVLVLLYSKPDRKCRLAELKDWVRPTMRSNLRRTLAALDQRNLVHLDESSQVVTLLIPGIVFVEQEGLLDAA